MYDLLLIGSKDWQQVLTGFAQYKTDTGMAANFLSLEEIEKTGNGVDFPEKIKQAIEKEHRLNGIQYVLLAGDADRFPCRYIKAINTEWGVKWYPSDLYYADLYDTSGNFDNWDADKDGILAELDFKEFKSGPKFNIDKINLVPDVGVGRVPASTLEELETYLTKVRSYEFAASESTWFNNPDPWFRRALFVVDGGSTPFGDETQSEQHAAPLTAAGIAVTRRYQDDPPWANASPPFRAAEINRLLDDGLGFLHWHGHGGRESFAGWYDADHVQFLHNELKLPIVVALACFTARFHTDRDSYTQLLGGDWTSAGTAKPDRPQPAAIQAPKHDVDSMAEAFLVKHPAGGIAYVGCTSVMEHGGKPLGLYFCEAYRDQAKPPVLGAMWRHAMTRFAQNECGGGTIGMGPYYAFIHAHKVMLFGDPSLRVGGLAPYRVPGTGQSIISAGAMIQALA